MATRRRGKGGTNAHPGAPVREEDHPAHRHYLLARAGYLQDFLGDDAPQPSVYNLNALVGVAGVSPLLRYLLGGGVDYQALHFNMEAMTSEKILSKSREHCPICGFDGLLGTGELFDLGGLVAEKQYPLPRP
jgi:hypothetical protein